MATTLLPAGVTTLIPLPGLAGKAGSVELPYQATNFLVGPNEPLKVKLAIPIPATAPATAPAPQ
jgi:hypothetical protein